MRTLILHSLGSGLGARALIPGDFSVFLRDGWTGKLQLEITRDLAHGPAHTTCHDTLGDALRALHIIDQAARDGRLCSCGFPMDTKADGPCGWCVDDAGKAGEE